ncbi:MAG TPA: serine/threonine-protein kinase [Polyangiaceae bacterium]|nr:serine/threonine-protein kinase [Polyangiaceae bacterium]
MALPTLAADVETVREGTVIAQKYRLESQLGEGGMGTIWRAYNLQLEVPVALKLLRAGLNPAELGERLRVEARAAAKLVHPGIVRVFDIGEAESGEPFIVMELLQGESLGATLERGPLSAKDALQLMLPICEALALAHSRGVVHRDLKPDNIFVAAEGARLQPKLLDFGIAKVRSSMLAGGPTLTQGGVLLGSPEYMSPEQVYGRADLDERSDIWGYCVVLYEILSGRTPFAGDSCQEILQAVLTHEPVPLALLDVDPELAALIHWGLSKDRDARPSSILTLGRELAAWLFARGVLEDATGASLDVKWLGRGNEGVALVAQHCPSSPRAEHEHATLVSVVHPSPHPAHISIEEPQIPGKRRWLPSAVTAIAVAAVALAGGLGWASIAELRRVSPIGAAAQAGEPPRERAAPAAAAAAPIEAPPARAEAITVDALPVEHAPPAPPTKEAAAAKAYAANAAWAKSAAAGSAVSPVAERALASTAPRALPQALPARDRPAELLNPY